jgi:hypothetical protein
MIKLDDADNADEVGGRTAAPNFAAMPSEDAWRPSSTLQSTGHLGVLRMMENLDNLTSNFAPETAGLALF